MFYRTILCNIAYTIVFAIAVCIYTYYLAFSIIDWAIAMYIFIFQLYYFLDTRVFTRKMRLAYYPGSFDPMHKGHLNVIETVLREGYADYVYIYALPVDGKRKKSKPQSIREKYIEMCIKHISNAILLKGSIETVFTMTDEITQHITETLNVEVEWIGIIGSDNTIVKSQNFHDTYMVREYQPDAPYDVNASRAITASSFIVFPRGDVNDINPRYEFAHSRPIMWLSDDNIYNNVSSTKVRNIITEMQEDPFKKMLLQDMLPIWPCDLLNCYYDNDSNKYIKYYRSVLCYKYRLTVLFFG